MRVAIDCRMADWSGVGRYTRGLVRALAARDDVEVVQVLERDAEPLADTETVVAAGHPFSLTGAASLGRAFAASGAEVLHCAHFPMPLRVGRPLVVTIHDIIPLRVPESMPRRLARIVYRAMVSRAVKMADAIIVPSAWTARDLASYWPVASNKTHVVPLAADDFVDGAIGSLPAEIAGKRYLLAMGSAKPHKGRHLLIEAFRRLAPEFADVLLVLAGDPGRNDRDRADAPDSDSRVVYTGRVDDSTLRALYRNAIVFVFPSLYEGFGLPPLEAMAFGTPVITTSAASLPEVVADAALTVPAGDVNALRLAMERLLREDQLRQTLAEEGLKRAAEFSWKRTAELTVQVYREALNR